MPKWKKKVFIDALKTIIPFKDTVRALFRSVRPYTTDPDNDALLHRDSEALAQVATRYGGAMTGMHVLEFGSGWNPTLPLVFRRAGARHVILTDQERLLNRALLLKTTYELGFEAEASLEFDALLEKLGLDYVVPFRPDEFASASVDMVVSRAALEHVAAGEIPGLFRNFRRILKPGCLMIHAIDLSDHWEHKDKTISRVNFLRFEDKSWFWKLANRNPQNIQNRFRVSDFANAIETAGFRVIGIEAAPDPVALKALATLPLASRFREKMSDDLATLNAVIVAI